MSTAAFPSIMTRLKTETADLHRYAESRPLQQSMFRGAVSAPVLTEYLGQLWLVHDALERRLDAVRGNDVAVASVFDDGHRHSVRLAADLARAGIDPATVPPTPGTAALLATIDAATPPALLGVLYVLEGSMNGNRFLAPRLAPIAEMPGAPGMTYFDPYGDAQRTRWESFRRRMDDVDPSVEDAMAIERAALRTFEAIAAISDDVAA